LAKDCERAEPITVLVEKARLFFYRKVGRLNARTVGKNVLNFLLPGRMAGNPTDREFSGRPYMVKLKP
jgi:hypothetical protein